MLSHGAIFPAHLYYLGSDCKIQEEKKMSRRTPPPSKQLKSKQQIMGCTVGVEVTAEGGRPGTTPSLVVVLPQKPGVCLSVSLSSGICSETYWSLGILIYFNGQMLKLRGLCLTPLFGILTTVSSPEVTVSAATSISATQKEFSTINVSFQLKP